MLGNVLVSLTDTITAKIIEAAKKLYTSLLYVNPDMWVILKDTFHFCTKKEQVALPDITWHIKRRVEISYITLNDARTHASYMLGSIMKTTQRLCDPA